MGETPKDGGERMNPLLLLATTLVTLAFVVWIVSAQSGQRRLSLERPSNSRSADFTARATDARPGGAVAVSTAP